MATTLATLPDFIVTVDMAMHTVIDLTDETGNVVQTIDFGVSGEVADAVNSWLFDQDPADRDIWAPVLNTYLRGEFAKREVKTRACYHPMSCSGCQRVNQACGDHRAGTPGHTNCKG
jgi:hypothetical protein